jgi:6-phosphogluconolactonase
MDVYVGTYTGGASEGIYHFRLDLGTGALAAAGSVVPVDHPSYLALHPSRPFLYSVNELGDFRGRKCGGVSAFAIDEGSGELSLLNQQASGGPGPCYVSVDATGRSVLVANYGGGSVAFLPLGEDGRLGEATDFIQHTGSSVNPNRQQAPHAHSIIPGPENRCAFAADLGLDKVMIYQLDLAAGKLRPNDPPWAQVHPGAGPRHVTFHPNGHYAYLINEIDSTLTAFAYDASRAALTELQTASTLPEGFEGRNSCADVHVHPSGKFLYGSNRGHDSIVIYALDAATGRPSYVGHEPTQGKTPRGFTIDPTGAFLLAANQNTDAIVTFRIDAATGQLAATGHVAQVPTPVCLKIRGRGGR